MILTEINIYPIKSTRGISLNQSEVLPRGLQWDRRRMLVDTQNRFVTARDHPRLALVETLVENSFLRVKGPNMAALTIPLSTFFKQNFDYPGNDGRCQDNPYNDDPHPDQCEHQP